ncbi:uncharacterized protein RSE6_13259 [Rhynchosporium secalis]|uniref:Phosphatidate phosphatase APP1 catalytic domain-containing protein n=1 Tax=Rhynchosporium secalis TaxID=38038 RepID=A0A1E1MSF7_RHYSE|nr:uncharacterized protein RSE6_13259 [Rhynchosporium secalis]
MSSSEGEEHCIESSAAEEENILKATKRQRMNKRLLRYVKAAEMSRRGYKSTSTDHAAAQDGQKSDGAASRKEGKVIRQGDEILQLFPSYAKHHVKLSPKGLEPVIHLPGEFEPSVQEVVVEDEDDAIVDVDVRGWVYSPHRGPLPRKYRVLIGLARKLSGIPAPEETKEKNKGFPETETERVKIEKERRMIATAAGDTARRGIVEEKLGRMGEYSEAPTTEMESTLKEKDGPLQPTKEKVKLGASAVPTSDTNIDQESQASWQKISDMTPEELREADTQLLSRLRHFTNWPIVSEPVTMTFSNKTTTATQTTLTNPAGHFSLRASLPFIPTEVRASCASHANITASQPVIITQPTGISVITDIDDTIKHSSVSSGIREVFRNVFIRPLDKLTIKGVAEWYQTLHSLGVSFHYVSNSPWQLYPLLVSFFSTAGLPDGSYHLKHYNGMLRGIFEPVAERKKGTLEQLMRDFPERRWMLIGDSGEADLEVYTDVVLENPGKVVAIFIRDVTTDAIQEVLQKSGVKDVPNGTISDSTRNSRSQIRIGEHSSSDPITQKQNLTEASLKSHTAYTQHLLNPATKPEARIHSQSYRALASSYLPTSWQSSISDISISSDASTVSSDDLESLAGELQTWTERWARATVIMEREGVVLRSWAVGGDVVDECVALVEREGRECGIEVENRIMANS